MMKGTVELQELQQLTAAAEELQSVRADYEQQLQQVREMAENTRSMVKISVIRFKSWSRSWRMRLKGENE